MSRLKTVVGVDGCAGGWVCLALDLGTRQISPHLLPDFLAVLGAE
jgi:predicted RNase H-like nuclease